MHRTSALSSTVLLNNSLYGFDNIHDVDFRHIWIDRKGDYLLVNGTGVREIFGTISVSVPVMWVKMEGDEMDAGTDVFFL